MNTKTFFSLLAAVSFCVVAPAHAAQETAGEKASDAWDATKKTTKNAAKTVANTTKQAANKAEKAVTGGPTQKVDVSVGNTGVSLNKKTVSPGRIFFSVLNTSGLPHKIGVQGGTLKNIEVNAPQNTTGTMEVDLTPGT